MSYLVEPVTETLRLLPLLIAVLIVVELLEHRMSGRFQHGLARIGRWGPAVGAGIGAFPQCGGAIVASELYAARAVTLGTLLAVYLATSDEALTVLAINPTRAATIAPLLLTKIAIGLIAGYAVDLLASRRAIGIGGLALTAAPGLANGTGGSPAAPSAGAEPHSHYEAHACLEGRLSLTRLLLHALRRAVRVAAFITLTTAALNWAGQALASLQTGGQLVASGVVEVVAAASFGLIPSCAPSVALTDLFVKGAVRYPALIAGLCANAGAGLLVLLHEAGWRAVVRVASLLLLISIGAGLALMLF
ncbi:MAG: putative manganese transporter [Chloroflexota bacterium]